MNTLGELIKAKRESMKLSLREFADMCNVSHSYIKNLEDGNPRTGRNISPTLEYLERISPVLGMSVEDLLKQIGYIQKEKSEFYCPNLKIIRGDKSYEDICKEIEEKTGAKIEPSVYEAVEKGIDKNPSPLFIDVLAKFVNVDRSFFYRKNTPNLLEYAKKMFPYQQTGPRSESIPYLPDILEDILKFVSDPSNLEYLVLAKELSEKKIKAKLVRDVLFDE
ncbi:MAG: helix-turn-helix transcriptional regulator [Clostridiaceae bacterium]|nr:helix-turn-helix transcriptional regulator [Clostridiaceae bacterium]